MRGFGGGTSNHNQMSSKKISISDSAWINITIFVRALDFQQPFPTTITVNETIRVGAKMQVGWIDMQTCWHEGQVFMLMLGKNKLLLL